VDDELKAVMIEESKKGEKGMGGGGASRTDKRI
jgi:hypothetical protein